MCTVSSKVEKYRSSQESRCKQSWLFCYCSVFRAPQKSCPHSAMEAMTSEIEIRGCTVKNNENSASSTTDLYNHVIYNNFNATGVKTQVGVHDRFIAQLRVAQP